MKLEDLICISENVDLDEYLSLYKYVRENMEHPEWLGTFTKEEIENILKNNGKIWLFYKDNDKVCSMFYIPSSNKSLRKHNINYDESETGSLGPIMVSPDYIGNGLQSQMMNMFDEYCNNIGKKYIFTKVCSDNLYSVYNVEKSNYVLTDTYFDERGKNNSYIKILN